METYHIGILTAVRESEFKSEITYSGWIKSSLEESVYFRSNQLVKREQKKNLRNNCFVSFHVRKNLEKDHRLDAVKCTLLSSRELVEQFDSYSFEDISFIISKANKTLLLQFQNKVKRAREVVVDEAVREKLDRIEKLLVAPEEVDGELVALKEETSSSFLDSIFKVNSDDYNMNLFQILVGGIKEIGNEEVYRQSKYLLECEKRNPGWSSTSLCDEFYHKASSKYKVQFWLDSFVNYVEPSFLKLEFESGTEEVKKRIQERLGGAENLFISHTTNTNIAKKGVEEVFFDDIRSKLIRELSAAEKNIKVAVAWFTNEELFAILCQKLIEGVRVELIVINDFINNSDFGLPFQEFIDRKGELYFAEYPQVMHHKFCVIDHAVLFNGSYNWTYYAEDRNDENIMLFKNHGKLVLEFNREFSRLKKEIGEPVKLLERFDIARLAERDFFGARNYLSRDLGQKARAAFAAGEVLAADRFAEKALTLDNADHIIKFREEIKGQVELYKNSALALSIISHSGDVTSKNSDLISEASPGVPHMQTDSESAGSSEIVDPISELPINVETSANDNLKTEIEESAPSSMDSDGKPTEVTEMEQDLRPKPILSLDKPIDGDQNKESIKASEANSSVIHAANPQQRTVNISRDAGTQTINSSQRPQAVPVSPKTSSPLGSTIVTSNTTPGGTRSANDVFVPYVTGNKVEITHKEAFPRLKMVVGLDISGSMKNLFHDGTMQRVLEKSFSAAMSIAEQDRIDVYAFDKSPYQIAAVEKLNYSSYITTFVTSHFQFNGGTEISSCIRKIFATSFEENQPTNNVLAIIFTDGEDSKAEELRNIIKATSDRPIFWQFVGIGSKFDILESLKKIQGRTAENVGFFCANNIDTIENTDLYSQLLLPFRSWFNEMQKKGMLLK